MNSKEFLERLGELLADIPKEEREEALQFYSEYFSEAGPFQEQAILDELVSPEHVASVIKKSLPDTPNEQEGGMLQQDKELFGDAPQAPEIPLPIYARRSANSGPAPQPGQQKAQAQPANVQPPLPKKEGGKTLLLVVLAVMSFPIWFSLLMTVAGLAFAVVVCGVAFLVAGLLAAAACVIVLIVNLGLILGAGLGTGLLAAGILLLGIAVSLLLAAAGGFILFWLIPAVCHVVKKFIINPLRGKGVA